MSDTGRGAWLGALRTCYGVAVRGMEGGKVGCIAQPRGPAARCSGEGRGGAKGRKGWGVGARRGWGVEGLGQGARERPGVARARDGGCSLPGATKQARPQARTGGSISELQCMSECVLACMLASHSGVAGATMVCGPKHVCWPHAWRCHHTEGCGGREADDARGSASVVAVGRRHALWVCRGLRQWCRRRRSVRVCVRARATTTSRVRHHLSGAVGKAAVPARTMTQPMVFAMAAAVCTWRAPHWWCRRC